MATPSLGFTSGNIVLGAGDILHQRRGVTLPTVTAIVTPAPTTTTFSVVNATDMVAGAEKLRVGDVLQLASATPAHTASEASTAPRIVSLVSDGTNTAVTVSPAFSAAPPTTAGGVRVLYKMLGATDGGIQVGLSVSRNPQYIDQSPFPVANPIDTISGTVTAPLAETLASNIALALGVAPGATEGAGSMGGSTVFTREDRILTVTPAPGGKARFWVSQKCQSSGESTLTASKTEKGIINLTLAMMPDTTLGDKGVYDFLDA